MNYPPAVLSFVGLELCLIFSAGTIEAQDGAGLEANATLSFGVIYEDEALRAQSALGFSLSSSTRTQSLGFSLSSGLETGRRSALDFVDPSVLLTYNRIGQNALFSVDARYNQSDLGGFELAEDSTSAELVATTGSKNDLNLSTNLEFGTASLFGGTVSLGWRQIQYSGATTLDDYQTFSAGLALRFSVDPRVDLRTTANFQETLVEGSGTARTNLSLGVGVDFALNVAFRVSADLSYSQIEKRPATGDTQIDSGPVFSLVAEKDFLNGALRLDLSTLVTDSGTGAEARVTRTLKTARGDDFLLSAGLSRGDNGDLKGIFGVEFTRVGQNSEFAFSLTRGVQGDVFGQESLRTEFRVGYEIPLSRISELSSAVAFRETEFPDSTMDRTRKLELKMGYAQQLTRDLDLTAEVAHTRSWSGSDGPDVDNTVYVGLERKFNWRP